MATIKRTKTWQGEVAHTCNPNTLRGPRWANHLRSGVRHQPGQHDENPISSKNTKISWVWWCMSVIPAPREAKAGKLLKPGRQSQDCATVLQPEQPRPRLKKTTTKPFLSLLLQG